MRAAHTRCARETQEKYNKKYFVARASARAYNTHACTLRDRASFSCAIVPLMIPIDANTYFCSKEKKKNNVVFVDTILLLSVENVGFFQGKILERESHEMISLTLERKV